MNEEIYVSEEVYAFLRYIAEVSQKDFNTDTIMPLSMFKGFLYGECDLLSEVLFDYGAYNNELEFYMEDILDSEEQKDKKNNNYTPKNKNKDIIVKEVKVNCIENNYVRIFYIEESVFDIIIYALELVSEYKEIEEVDINLLTIAFVQKLPTDVVKVLRRCDIPIKELKKEVTIQNVISSQIIPKELAAFLKDLNLEIDKEKTCQILGRDEETDKLWNILLKKEKANAILVGKPGVGKTAIVEKIAYDIVTQKCPKQFYDFHVISLSVNSIIAGTQYRGDAEKNFDELIKYIESNQNIILFIDEIHTVLGAGACKEGEMDLANALKPVLARGKCKVVGSTTLEEYKKYFSKDGALKRRFKSIIVEEPENDEVYNMIKNKIDTLQEFHGVKISRKMIDKCILYATCFDYETANPDRTLDVIDVAMAKTKRNGFKNVTEKSILATFNMNFNALKKMSQEDIKATAYHEAGHFVVSIFSKNVKDKEILAVSTIPTDDYLGVNAWDEIKYAQVTKSSLYLKETMAIYMGGRIAEAEITYFDSTGASEDLKLATSIARKYITKYGLSEAFSHNCCIFSDEDTLSELLSERSKIKYEDELARLIKESYEKAKDIITKHHELLVTVASSLINKLILSKEDLEEIVSEYKSKNHIS